MSLLNPVAAGDVVQLKSGGPEMAVSDVLGGAAVCVWFEELASPTTSISSQRFWGRLQSKAIRASALRIVR